ncbi:cell division protein FtsQ/DivIB [Microbacteriaceae bacterium 4G12]
MKNKKVIQLEDRVPKLKQQKQKRKKANRRLILYVSILFLLVLFLIYFRSPFSNVGNIAVQGNHYMDKEQVMKISNITYDTSYFRVMPDQTEAKLLQQKEVKSAVVKKIFPNKISIVIEEYKTIGYLKQNDKLSPLLEDGNILSYLPSDKLPVQAPILFEFKDKNIVKDLSSELNKLSPNVFRSISEIHLDPQPSDPLHLTLYMTEGYEVSTTVQDFANKMTPYPLILKQLKPGDKVRIHLGISAYTESLTTGDKSQ